MAFDSLTWHRCLCRMRVRLVIWGSWVRFPPGPTTFFCGDWSWSIFYCHSLYSHDSADWRRTVVSFWRKINRLQDWDCPGKVWSGKLSASTRPEWLDWGVKPQLETLPWRENINWKWFHQSSYVFVSTSVGKWFSFETIGWKCPYCLFVPYQFI